MSYDEQNCDWDIAMATEEIERLRAEVKELKEADGLPTQAALYVHAIKTISELRAIVDKLPKWAKRIEEANDGLITVFTGDGRAVLTTIAREMSE